MGRRRTASTLALLCGVALSACVRPTDTVVPRQADNALTLSLPSASGESVALRTHRGDVVVVDVWATWCRPCRRSLPTFQSIATDFAARGVVFYTLNVDERGQEDPKVFAAGLIAHLAALGVHLPILLETPDKRAQRALGFTGVPMTYVIDRRGVVRFVHAGARRDMEVTLRAQLERLVAAPPT